MLLNTEHGIRVYNYTDLCACAIDCVTVNKMAELEFSGNAHAHGERASTSGTSALANGSESETEDQGAGPL